MPPATIAAAACACAALIAAAPGQRASTRSTPSAPARAARSEPRVPFAPGERLSYDISWSSSLTAGTAVLSVQEKKASFGSIAYYIVAEGQPSALLSKLYRLYYKADTLLDAYALLPQRASIYSEEGKRRRFKITTFNAAAKSATFEVRTDTTVRTPMTISRSTQDPLAAIYVLRARPLKAGDRMTMPIADNGQQYTIDVGVSAPEVVRCGLGAISAWKLTPVARGAGPAAREIALWISDDSRRLPVKISAELPIGRFEFTLRQAQGASAAAP
jgi:Protein of unknown function (DUF3108)